MILSTLSLHILTNSFLALGIVSVWLKRHVSIWGVFLAISLLGAWFNNKISLFGLGVVLVLFILGFLAQHGNKPLKWLWLCLLAAGGVAVSLHMSPGIFNWNVVHATPLSADSYPYALWINLDKALVALAILVSGASLMPLGKGWLQMWKEMGWWVCGTVALLMAVSYGLGVVRYDLKWAPYGWLWVVNNLLFVCVAEELLFRRILQKELLARYWGNFPGGRLLSVFLAAVLFGLYHYRQGPTMIGLSALAGLCYGAVYARTDKIESAISLHFIVNLIHFAFFSYPALKP